MTRWAVWRALCLPFALLLALDFADVAVSGERNGEATEDATRRLELDMEEATGEHASAKLAAWLTKLHNQAVGGTDGGEGEEDVRKLMKSNEHQEAAEHQMRLSQGVSDIVRGVTSATEHAERAGGWTAPATMDSIEAVAAAAADLHKHMNDILGASLKTAGSKELARLHELGGAGHIMNGGWLPERAIAKVVAKKAGGTPGEAAEEMVDAAVAQGASPEDARAAVSEAVEELAAKPPAAPDPRMQPEQVTSWKEARKTDAMIQKLKEAQDGQ